MIVSFADRATKKIWQGQYSKSLPPEIQKQGLRKLIMLNAAKILGDLAVPPGNRLEALKGDLAGMHSICINDQWRIVFLWSEQGPEDVVICDYHS